MTFIRLQNGVYQVYDRKHLVGTVHRGVDPMPRRWYAYASTYLGTCATRKDAANLLRPSPRRRRRRGRRSVRLAIAAVLRRPPGR